MEVLHPHSLCNYRRENGPASSSGEVHRADHIAAGDNGSSLWCHGQVNKLKIFPHKTQLRFCLTGHYVKHDDTDMMPRLTPLTWIIG